MQKALVIGGVSYNSMIYLEKLPDPHSQTIFSKNHHETIGGTGAGKALNLTKLGLDVSFHGMIGDDEQGRVIQRRFKDAGIHFLYDIDPKGTERHTNLMSDDGSRISIYVNYATFEPDIHQDKIIEQATNIDVFVLNIINYCRKLIPDLKKTGKNIWCDIHDYDGESDYHQDFINAADIITMSSDSLPDYRLFMEKLIVLGKKLVICTHGKNGSTALDAEGHWYETPALSYTMVDTNGAGDSFFAGCLYGHLNNYAIENCLKLGTIAGGLCITSFELVYEKLSESALLDEYKKHYGALPS